MPAALGKNHGKGQKLTDTRVEILIVDDQPTNLAVLARLLTECGYGVRAVTSGERALEAATIAKPACVLLDVSMPGMDGFETCAAFQADPRLRSIPIIFLTAHEDIETRVRAFAVGGRDYVAKPFRSEEVLARVQVQVRLTLMEEELRRQAQSLQDANDKLREAAALKGRMTAMLIHDLRSPLTVLASLLNGPTDADSLADAEYAYEKVTRLIEDMLDLTREENQETAPLRDRVLLSTLLEGAVRIASYHAEAKGVTLQLASPTHPTEVLGDASVLDRVFANLLDNALKFAPRGGSVVIEMFEEKGVGVERGLSFAGISVRDDGPGIPPEDLPFIFDPYRQGSLGRERGGYGLGLAIVARGVSQHQGRVQVRSQMGVGTEFLVLLPLAP